MPVKMSELKLQFQGGFSGKSCKLEGLCQNMLHLLQNIYSLKQSSTQCLNTPVLTHTFVMSHEVSQVAVPHVKYIFQYKGDGSLPNGPFLVVFPVGRIVCAVEYLVRNKAYPGSMLLSVIPQHFANKQFLSQC